MVKFSKQLEAQLIPEWKDAFVNYWLLKKHVKRIKVHQRPKLNARHARDFCLSVFDPIRSAACTLSAQLLPGRCRVQMRAETEASEDELVTSEAGDEESQNENEPALLVSEEDEAGPAKGWCKWIDRTGPPNFERLYHKATANKKAPPWILPHLRRLTF